MSAVDVEADDPRGRITAMDESHWNVSVIHPHAFGSFEAISAVHQNGLLWLAGRMPEANRHPDPVLFDVLTELGEFLVRHHREDVSRRMHFVIFAPLADRLRPVRSLRCGGPQLSSRPH